VCTTVRPTLLSYCELAEWHNAAQFVANYVDYELLDDPTELVRLMHMHAAFVAFKEHKQQ